MSFLIAHHINGYDMILGADFLLNPLHVMAITPYTIMLYEKDRTVCTPFVSKNTANKSVLTSNCEAFALPVGKTADIEIKCPSDAIVGKLEKFTPLVTFLSKGLLVEKIYCFITIPELSSMYNIPAPNSSPENEENVELNSKKLHRSRRSRSSDSNTSYEESGDLTPDYSIPDYTTDIEDEIISQNEVIDPTNLDKKRSYKDCTVNPDLPENISTSLWEMLKNHKSVFATSKLDVSSDI